MSQPLLRIAAVFILVSVVLSMATSTANAGDLVRNAADELAQDPPCLLSSKYPYGWDGSTDVYCLRSIVIFVHGVNTGPGVYDQWVSGLFRSGDYPQLTNTFFVYFNWESDSINQASDQVGGRANSVSGMSDRAFYAVWKLGQTVAGLNRLFPEIPITIVSHSQGTIVTLAALQEGMGIDYWILMGSPLDREIVAGCESGENVDLPYAATHVRNWLWNLWSDEDDIAALKGGIGAFGLAPRCDGASYGNNVYDGWIPYIDHFMDNSWWDFDHMRANMSSDQFQALLSALTAENRSLVGYFKQDIDQFNNLDFQFAINPPTVCIAEDSCVEWAFQDSDYDSAYYDLLLPQGLLTGWYMDDKDRGHYTLSCNRGGASVRILGAQWSTFDEGEDWTYVPQGYYRDSSYTVDSAFYDATLWVQVHNADPGISECSLFFEAWDD